MPWQKLRTTLGRQKVDMVPRHDVRFGKTLPEVNSSAVGGHFLRKAPSIGASARWLLQGAAAETSGSPWGKSQRGQTGTPEGKENPKTLHSRFPYGGCLVASQSSGSPTHDPFQPWGPQKKTSE